jgi:hypothetical protein
VWDWGGGVLHADGEVASYVYFDELADYSGDLGDCGVEFAS